MKKQVELAQDRAPGRRAHRGEGRGRPRASPRSAAIITITLLLVTAALRAGAGDAGVGRRPDRQRVRGRGRCGRRGRQLEAARAQAAGGQPARAEARPSLHEGAVRMSDGRHEIGQLEHDVDLIRANLGELDRRAQQPAARRPGHPAAVPPSRRPSGPGRRGPDRDGRGRHRAVRLQPAARTVVAARGPAASGKPCGAPSPTRSIWRNAVPACRARSPPPAAARWPRRSASGSPGAWYRRRAIITTNPPRAAVAGACSRLAHDAAKAEVAGGRVDRLRHARGRAGSAGNSSARRGTSRPSSPCAGIGSATHGLKLRSRAATSPPLQQACVPSFDACGSCSGAYQSVVHSQTLPIMS